MRAISLWQPWASAIVRGKKTVETRGWSTKYRGIVAIHAAKRWTREQRSMCSRYLTVLFHEIPLGQIVATAEIVSCVPTEQFAPHHLERVWGDYGPDRFAWVLDNIRPLEAPISYKGHQGFFTVEDDLIYGSVIDTDGGQMSLRGREGTARDIQASGQVMPGSAEVTQTCKVVDVAPKGIATESPPPIHGPNCCCCYCWQDRAS